MKCVARPRHGPRSVDTESRALIIKPREWSGTVSEFKIQEPLLHSCHQDAISVMLSSALKQDTEKEILRSPSSKKNKLNNGILSDSYQPLCSPKVPPRKDFCLVATARARNQQHASIHAWWSLCDYTRDQETAFVLFLTPNIDDQLMTSTWQKQSTCVSIDFRETKTKKSGPFGTKLDITRNFWELKATNTLITLVLVFSCRKSQNQNQGYHNSQSEERKLLLRANQPKARENVID